MPCRRSPPIHARGFTLVEVLVALLVMSIIATLAWQGIDGMLRTRDASRRRLEATLRLGTVLAQWQQDLASVQDSGAVPALRCDGASLQLTRRAADGLQLVVWSLREGRWLRWAPAATTSSLELQEQWLRSQQLLGNEAAQVRVLERVAEWQLYFYFGNAWANCQSSGDIATAVVAAAAVSAPTAAVSGASAPAGGVAATAAPQRGRLPSGVRLQLRFAPGADYAGSLVRDSLLPPPAP